MPEHRADAFARLFEAVHEGVYIGLLGPRETTTLAANPHLKVMFGYAAEARDGQIRPFDAPRFVDPQARVAFIERLASEGAVTDYLLRLRRVDNSPVWVEVTAHADSPSQDGSVRIDALVRDVSERKKLEDQTRDLYHQLLQAEKLAALGQTISGVAHELNNPLATILTWAERLSQRPPSEIDEKTRRGLETILSESERAAKIVRNLLTFARKRQSTRAMVDLNHVVRETLSLRSYEQRITNITIVDALAAGLPQVFADAHQVQQVLAESDHQRRAGDADGERPRHSRRAQLARRRARVDRPRDQRRWPRNCGRAAAEDFRPVLHDEGGRQGHGPRVDRRVRDRAGARRPHPPGIESGIRRIVLRRASRQRHAAAAACSWRRSRPTSTRSQGRLSWSSKTSRHWRPP